MVKKVILLVFDSVGVGAMPDAADYDDTGSNTLANTAAAVGGLSLPNLQRLGMGNIVEVAGVPAAASPLAAWGRLAEASPAKDTVTGHWELAGLISPEPFAIYHDGFPAEVIAAFEEQTGFGTLFNRASSGTVVLEKLGQEHMESGKLIVYTSADSVFQIAAHEEVVPVEKLHEACETARNILDPLRVARVIARPFVGKAGNFQRTYNRKDFCMEPSGPTLLDHLTAVGVPVIGVGKIEDIFAGRGVAESVHTEGNQDGWKHTLELNRRRRAGFIFVNLVDFDMLFGHRRNPEGYARALEESDVMLGQLLDEIDDETAVLITADHGCDPTHTVHTDHTREYVPVLALGPGVPAGMELGTRSTFADLARTVARLLGHRFDMAGTEMW